MNLTSVILPDEVKLVCSIFNVAACAVLFLIRLYQWTKQKIEDPKLSLTGLLSMFFALLFCSLALNLQSNWYFGDKRWCDLSIKMAPASYLLHRYLLYIFIILRLEAVNQSNFISSRILSAIKAVIGACAIVFLCALIIFTEGAPDEHSTCSVHIESSVYITGYVADTAICVTGTWLFFRPIKDILRDIEDGNLRYMLRKTKIWSIVSLVTTLVATFFFVVIDGVAGIMAFDSSHHLVQLGNDDVTNG